MRKSATISSKFISNFPLIVSWQSHQGVKVFLSELKEEIVRFEQRERENIIMMCVDLKDPETSLKYAILKIGAKINERLLKKFESMLDDGDITALNLWIE